MGLTIIPPFGLYRMLRILADNVSNRQPGLTMAEVGHPEVRMSEIWVIWAIEWAVVVVLA